MSDDHGKRAVITFRLTLDERLAVDEFVRVRRHRSRSDLARLALMGVVRSTENAATGAGEFRAIVDPQDREVLRALVSMGNGIGNNLNQMVSKMNTVIKMGGIAPGLVREIPNADDVGTVLYQVTEMSKQARTILDRLSGNFRRGI